LSFPEREGGPSVWTVDRFVHQPYDSLLPFWWWIHTPTLRVISSLKFREACEPPTRKRVLSPFFRRTGRHLFVVSVAGDTKLCPSRDGCDEKEQPSPGEKEKGTSRMAGGWVPTPIIRFTSHSLFCGSRLGATAATIRKTAGQRSAVFVSSFKDKRFSFPYCQPIIRATATVTIWVRSSNRNRGTNHFHHFSTLTPAIPAHTGAMAVGHRMLDSPSPYWKHSTAS